MKKHFESKFFIVINVQYLYTTFMIRLPFDWGHRQCQSDWVAGFKAWLRHRGRSGLLSGG